MAKKQMVNKWISTKTIMALQFLEITKTVVLKII